MDYAEKGCESAVLVAGRCFGWEELVEFDESAI